MDFTAEMKARTDAMLDLLTELIQIESPTYVKGAVDQLGVRVQQELEDLGASIKVEMRQTVGDIVIGRWNEDKPGRPIIFVCHLDTVYPIGALADNPVRIEEGRLYGPGANDEKGGIVTALTALRTLIEADMLPERPITALFTSDEETGSDYSRELIMEMAQEAALCLVLEAALPDGSLKTWRKSTGRFVVRAHGKAAHAGGAHEYGVNAIEELAHQVIALQGMTRHGVGTTVSVGMVSGGIARNVIPDAAEAIVDVRASSVEEMERLETEINGLKPVLLGADVEVQGGFDRPPMIRDEQMMATFQRAKEICARYGMTLRESGTGGASDGNYTSSVGAPTLDGLGPIGTGAHSERENVVISSLARSASILAAVTLHWPID